jgi:hypothetical protein
MVHGSLFIVQSSERRDSNGKKDSYHLIDSVLLHGDANSGG